MFMKTHFPFVVLLTVLSSGCKKDDVNLPYNNTNTTNTTIATSNPFAENEALIDKNASVYLVADVEGLSGITKINVKAGTNGISAGYGAGSCTTGSSKYHGSVGCSITGSSWDLDVMYYGQGETREKLNVPAYTKLITPAYEKHGVIIQYTAPNNKLYISCDINNTAWDWSNIVLDEIVPSGGTPPYFVKLRFNCKLKQYNGSGVISLKNAIVRLRL